MVAKHHPEAIAPGYWFVTPYSNLAAQVPTPRREHVPCQAGPCIYDGDGTLVWSGACKYGNRNVFGLQPVHVNGSQILHFSLPGLVLGHNITEGRGRVSGVLMNNHYEEISRTVLMGVFGPWLDTHEFNVQLDGKSTIGNTLWFDNKDDPSSPGQPKRPILGNGFREIDLTTGTTMFDWSPFAHGLLFNESYDSVGRAKTGELWDWMHLNSVDKNAHGDYLVSGRHTCTVYKISGVDGHVIWRLGGSMSDFIMDEDVPFHWQHHARFRFENETHTIISLFDNGSKEPDPNPDIPERLTKAKIIVLDIASKPMTAKLLRVIDHPEAGRSPKLGSVQIIGDNVETGNVFVDWAMQGYISEHDAQNRVVLEAKFLSDRMRTYRAFKYPWVGKPSEPPVLKVLPIGYADFDEAGSAFYVSWNGATEVASWAFYGGAVETGEFNLLARVKKRGFETSWATSGVVKYAYAEAIDINGQSLGKSATTTITPLVNGTFKVMAPVWEEAANIANGSSQAASKENAVTKFFLVVAYFGVVGFALFGLYCAVRNIIHHVSTRRKGYKALPAFVKSPWSYRRHGVS